LTKIKQTKYYCDLCGKEFSEFDLYHIDFPRIIANKIEIKKIDVCKTCLANLSKIKFLSHED
jgi:hypothetical protein